MVFGGYYIGNSGEVGKGKVRRWVRLRGKGEKMFVFLDSEGVGFKVLFILV